MKTFKLVSLSIAVQDSLSDLPLADGLIINKEDENNSWLIEGYLDKSFYDFFKKAMDEQANLNVQAVITKKDNDPAPFLVKIKNINVFETHISVLMEGKLKMTKNKYAESLLIDLVESGLTGKELISTFKEKMENKLGFAIEKKL